MKSLAGEALQEPLVGRKVSDVVWEEQKLGGNLEKRVKRLLQGNQKKASSGEPEAEAEARRGVAALLRGTTWTPRS